MSSKDDLYHLDNTLIRLALTLEKISEQLASIEKHLRPKIK
jgi:hypothetical protein